MTDKSTKLAELCVRYSVNVKPKEIMVIKRSVEAAPPMIEVHRQSLLCDVYPGLLPNLHAEYAFYKNGKFQS